MNKIPITGLFVCYNEELVIRHMLESFRRIEVDELIGIDSFSTDRTVDICKEYNANIIQYEFSNHRDQKNLVIEKASNTWCLLLDCDEYLNWQLEKNLQSLLQWAELNQVDCIEVPRYNVLNGEGKRGWPDTQARIFKNYVRHWGHPYHHDCRGNAKKNVVVPYAGHIMHIKDQEKQEHQNRLYYSLRPQDYQTLPEGVTQEFADKCKEAVKNTNPDNPNLYKEIIKKGLV